MEEGFGLQIEFESFPDVEKAFKEFESLARERSGIELQNVRHDGQTTLATVFVPDGKLHILENIIRSYLEKETKKGEPRYRKRVDTIRNIRAASIRSLWTDDPAIFPSDPNENLWWEVWLPVRKDRQKVIDQFCQIARNLGFKLAEGVIEFPERSVLLIYGSLEQMQQSVVILNSIAELRRAKETAEFFDSLPPEEQPDWVEELLQRMEVPEEEAPVPHVCLLDTGVNIGHPILAPAIQATDTHTIEPGWGKNDNEGHGTKMAGLALLGNLTEILDSSEPVYVTHRLESVKLLDKNHSNTGDSKHHGYLTIESVSRPEITAPTRQRVFSMAISARDGRDRGRPSAWSAALDRLASDYDNESKVEKKRLIVVSAGNIDDNNAWAEYPSSNTTDAIHDPGQSWNALTVGAYTEFIQITEDDADGYQPIAPAGGLSPFSTTSASWQNHWPLKPDVVFEGGNVAKDRLGAVWLRSLSLLTTNADFNSRLFTTANATSAATSLAARMAAQLMAAYPDLRPESIRGLIIHSAEWTPTMLQQFLRDPEKPNKSEVAQLVRHCGFGVPDLFRAMWSVENSLTLICEDTIQPFIKRDRDDKPKLCDMNLHRLPWPREDLEALGDTEVEMRVTLSYFIEPNPSSRGVKTRYRYESHGLRFDVKRPNETENDFRRRINKAAREEEGEEERIRSRSDSDPQWLLGPNNRHRGSVHSDIWRGTAADLASRGVLAVYPVSGWWKTRQKLGHYNRKAPYTLLVSIKAPEIDVCLYTSIANMIKTSVEVEN